MKLIFMGTPDFAIPSLERLIKSDHEVVAVVTATDKPKGRGQKVSFSPVKEYALQNNIPVLQPDKLKDENFINQLKEFNAELFVVVAFRILPETVFNIPPKGSFNLHASLLPKFRGAAPIQWALIKGESETGVTTFKLEQKVDTGNVYLQEKINIDEEDNLETLHDKLAQLGAEAVLKTVDLIESGDYELKSQDDSLATPAPKIKKETGQIDWNKPAEEIHNLVRGLSPFPGAYFYHNDLQIKIYKSLPMKRSDLEPGEFYEDKKNLVVGCKNSSLSILELQKEGKKRMGVEEFLRGYSFK